MKTYQDYAELVCQQSGGKAAPHDVNLDVMEDLFLQAQQEAFQAGFEAGREKAAVKVLEGHEDSFVPVVKVQLAKAIRAIPTPEMPTEGEMGNAK